MGSIRPKPTAPALNQPHLPTVRFEEAATDPQTEPSEPNHVQVRRAVGLAQVRLVWVEPNQLSYYAGPPPPSSTVVLRRRATTTTITNFPAGFYLRLDPYLGL